MPVLDSPRRELFAQHLAMGETQIEAYEKAGYVPNDGNACVVANLPAVKERTKEISGKIAAKTEITLDGLVSRAEKIYEKSIELQQMAAATGALKELGVLTGKRVERREVGAPGEFAMLDRMTADQLEAFALGTLDLATIGITIDD